MHVTRDFFAHTMLFMMNLSLVAGAHRSYGHFVEINDICWFARIIPGSVLEIVKFDASSQL